MIKIKVLGCSGAEMPGHNPTSFLINDSIAIDAGSITNTLEEKKQWKIEDIFITHAHLDHIRGIPFLADNLIIKRPNHKVNVRSINSVIQTIKDNLLNTSVWPDFTVIPHPNNGIIKLVQIKEGVSVEIKDISITAYKVNHSVPAVGYLIEDKKGKKVFFTGDTGPTDSTWKKLNHVQINILIIEVSFPNKMRELAILTGHLTSELLSEELKKIDPKPEKIFITHPKPQFITQIKKELSLLKIKNLSMLKDGMQIKI
ncbi:MAG: 3',5'-cyclic-nucleotide phosphodiesterase [Thermodesulfovibrionales bacterium]|nr:3',5'-cyclic-nucleotide phosphodiesterase [Thermodesulfovibrionales bacterium]